MQPFSATIELPNGLSDNLHRCQVYLSLSPNNPNLLRVAIVSAADRVILLPDGQLAPDESPQVRWLP